MEETAESHQRNSVGVGYLQPVCGALAWTRRCNAEGTVVVTEEGPFVAHEHAGEEGVVSQVEK